MLLKIKNWIFRTNSATYKKNVEKQNCSLEKDVQILFWPFFDRNNSFSYKHENAPSGSRDQASPKINVFFFTYKNQFKNNAEII